MVNRIATAIFDVVLIPFEWLGSSMALVLFSGVFGVLALLIFKHISSQKRIKAAKDKIKGHLIEIRLYQDDLAVVGGAVGKVLLRNFQYMGLNFGPILPLFIPFMIIAAQFVVRYAYQPVPVAVSTESVMAGTGTMLEIEFTEAARSRIADLRVTLPSGLKAVSPLVRAPSDGRAFQEIVATEAGEHEITLELPDGTKETKYFVAGDQPMRSMQPRRVRAASWWRLHDPNHCSLLWPAEAGFTKDSPFSSVAIAYPTRDLSWLPDGEFGILLTFFIASMVFGGLALKPLGVQI